MSEQVQSKQPHTDKKHLGSDGKGRGMKRGNKNHLNRIDSLFTELEQEFAEVGYEVTPELGEETSPPPTKAEEYLSNEFSQREQHIHAAEATSDPSPEADSQEPDFQPTHGDPNGSIGMQNIAGRSKDGDEQDTEIERFFPAESVLTPAGWESLRQSRPVVEQAQDDQPAVLAFTRPMTDASLEATSPSALLLEVLDEHPDRTWSEDELLLVEQVTDQLTLALENARLNAETRQQLKRQIILRDTMSAMISETDLNTMLTLACKQLVEAIGVTSGYISGLDQASKQTTVLAEYYNQQANEKERLSDLGETYDETETDFYRAILSGQIHIEHFNDPDLSEFSREHMTEYGAQSIVYLPLFTRRGTLGYVELWESRQRREFTVDEISICQDIARQASIAIERAQLNLQTQEALTALEVSERYQKAVAQAVTILTDRGIAALSDVLQTLGEATKASRAYYFETQVDQRGSYWRLISEWHAPDTPSQINNPALRRLSTRFIAPWLDALQADGYVAGVASEQDPQIKEFLDSFNTRSVLQFAVQGRHDIPGCIGFEQVDHDRRWSDDEIAALQTAASALASSIAREDLFTQLQINLAETEALYQASARLNTASTYDEILEVLRRHSILGHINACDISINMFDRTWSATERPNWVIPFAIWSTESPLQPIPERIPFESLLISDQIMSPDHASVVSDVANDLRLDERSRNHFQAQLGVKSLLYAPLNVAGRWIGYILGYYRQSTGIPEGEIRRLTSLAGQAAVAVESLRLLDETRQRNIELGTINQITTAASSTLDLNEVLADILQRLLQVTEFHGGLISIVDLQSGVLKLSAHNNLPEEMVNSLEEQGLDNTPCDLVYQLGKIINVANLADIPRHITAWKAVFDGPISIGFEAYLGVPLESKGQTLGTICLFNLSPKELEASRVEMLQAIGQQLGVVIENARLFRGTEEALFETEMLYQASARFQVSDEFEEILDSIRQHTILGEGSFRVSLELYDRPIETAGENNPLSTPTWTTPIAHWGSPLPWSPNEEQEHIERYPLQAFPALRDYLNPNEALIIKDIIEDERLDEKTRSRYSRFMQARATIYSPLVVGGLWIGHINALYAKAIDFEEADIRRMVALTGQAAVAVQNLRLLEETRRRATQLQTAAEIARDTSGTLALDALLERAVNLVRERFGYYHASFFLLDESETEAIVYASTGSAGEEMKRRGHKLKVGSRSVVGQAVAKGEPVVLNDVTEEAAKTIHRPNPLLPDTRAELGIPLKIGDQVIGALDVQSIAANVFSEDDIAVLKTLADQIAVAVDNARSYEVAQQAMEEIREADRLKSQFLANMSHELRTPLNSIIGFSRVILKGIDGPINELQLQDLTAIYNSGQHLLGLINDVLDLSRIEAGKMELSFEDNVNLKDIIKGVMSTTVGLVKDKPIELHQRVDPEVPRLRIDPMKIRQILLNLLSNAAKFTEEGSITVTANIQDGPGGEPEVIVRVIDTGHGIAEADQTKLFQPFSQVDASLTRKAGGSGLGLSISQHLVRLHGGQIGLESEPGKGTTFFFTLPLSGPPESPEDYLVDERYRPTPPDLGRLSMPGTIDIPTRPRVLPRRPAHTKPGPTPTEEEPAEETHSPPIESKPLSGETVPQGPKGPEDKQPAMNQADEDPPPSPATSHVSEAQENWTLLNETIILAIDKDPQITNLYKRYLEDFNLSVITLTDLEQSINIAKGVQPIVITLDINMEVETQFPEGILDGWQVLADLKSDPAVAHIPVLVCTILGEQEKAFKMGADGYLMKPFVEDDFIEAIRELIQDKKQNPAA